MWIVEAFVGFPHAIDVVGLPVLAAVFAVSAVMVHRRPKRLRTVEYLVLASNVAFFLASALLALANQTLGQEVLILNGYLPLVFGFAFLMLGPREGMNVSILVFAAFASIVVLALALGVVDGYASLPVFVGSGLVIALLSLVTFAASESARHQVRSDLEGATDLLTGALNRTAGSSAMDRMRGPFALLFVDVEGLAAINDQHGHTRGDEVLTSTARTIERDLRPRDLLIRWGGDEFVVVAPDTGVDGARALAARIVTRVETLRLRLGVDVRVSVGVAESLPGHPWSDGIETAALDQWSKRTLSQPA